MHYKSRIFFNKQQLNVDKENGVINNVVIVKKGIDKDNGYFTSEFLQNLVKKGNEQSQGVKSRFGHPNMCKTTLGNFIGRYKNFKLSNDKVIADLHLDPITQKTQVEGKGISMWDYILEMAENNPDMFGNSIHFRGTSEWMDKEIEGENKTVEVYYLESFIASDLVDSPAATDELFKSSEDFGVMGTQFLDENPEVFKAIEDNPSLIEDFLKRYKSYLKTKSKKNMKILKKVKRAVGVTKDIDLTLADGTIVTVQTDAENPAVGDRVVDADGKPLSDGEHLLPDGGKIITENGLITEITEPDNNGDNNNGDNTQAVEELQESYNSLKENYKKQQKEIEELEQAIEILADNFKTLAKSVKSKFQVPPKEGKNRIPGKKEIDDVYSKYRKPKEEEE